jgi:hypothetical protein
MVKITCTGRNLLNHCKQIGSPSDVQYSVVKYNEFTGNVSEILNNANIKEKNTSYVCTLTFDNKKYIAAGRSKITSIDNTVGFADGALRAFI